MMEEILLTLSGRSSVLSKWHPSEMNFELIHPGENELLSKLLDLGRLAFVFDEFVERFRMISFIDSKLRGEMTFGYYEAAFAEGLNVVLQKYRSHLVRLESSFRKSPSTSTLLYVQAELQSYFLVFHRLEETLDKICADKVRGCTLLNLLEENCNSDGSPVSECYVDIRRSCLRVLANSFVEWLQYGRLNDPFNEFFIQKNNSDQYFVRHDYCPSCLPSGLIDKLLFVGEKMVFCQSVESHQLAGEGSETKRKAFKKILEENYSEIRRIFVDVEFDPIRLQAPVERIRKAVSESLWNSVVVDCGRNDANNLFYCLNILHDFYFLGKGEFFSTFIDDFSRVVKAEAKSSRDFNQLLKNSYMKVYGVEPVAISNEVFRIKMRSIQEFPSLDRLEEIVELKLHVSPKLKQIFSDEVLITFDKVFAFLLKVRRIQANLSTCWAMLLKRRRRLCSASSVVEAKTWRTTNLMIFLVNNLQYYLHVDVLDSFFKTLYLKFVKDVKEFEVASSLLSEFARNVAVRCFSESKEIAKIIDGVLNDCERFSAIVTTIDELDEETRVSKIQAIFVEYERHSSYLFKVLSSPKMHLQNAHLCQLLQRLDYNLYFSSTSLF